MKPDFKIIEEDNQLYISNQTFDSLFDKNLFNPRWLQKNNLVFETAQGRAQVQMFNWHDHKLVLKHYCRGGLVSKVLRDSYLWSGMEKTRVYKEMKLLDEMKKLGLPVATAWYARVVRHGRFYRADIILEYLPYSFSLMQMLDEGWLAARFWNKIGQTIRQFHDHQVYHADLNASNILFSNESICLIDFDQSSIRPGNEWKETTLNRLKRSLTKQTLQRPGFYFDEHNWLEFMAGYKGL